MDGWTGSTPAVISLSLHESDDLLFFNESLSILRTQEWTGPRLVHPGTWGLIPPRVNGRMCPMMTQQQDEAPLCQECGTRRAAWNKKRVDGSKIWRSKSNVCRGNAPGSPQAIRKFNVLVVHGLACDTCYFVAENFRQLVVKSDSEQVVCRNCKVLSS